MSDSPVHFDPETIPAEINRWNWGAFLLNVISGIRNKTYIALLSASRALASTCLFSWCEGQR